MLFHRAVFNFYTESAVRTMKQNLFGKYTVTGLLGAGANSQVYLVRHQILKQDRAVKRIPKSLPGSSGFPMEAELMRSLKHPGIPIIYDIEEDDTYYYIVEEYVRGESLEAYLHHQQTISLNFLLQIGTQLCDIIGYLHAQPQPVIYQDLKPEHIIVYGDQIKIVDFGTASFFRNQENPYRSFGTMRYAAPEKQSGQECDERTDIYGIGIVLRYMESYLAPEQRSDDISRVIGRALEPDPDRRYENVDLLRKQLAMGSPDQVSVGKEHFPKNIAVVGMRAGIGATHIAVSWNIHLNAAGISSLYVQQDHSGDLMHMTDHRNVCRDERTGYVSYGDFRGTVSQGAVSERIIQERVCLIRDFGTYESMDIELETCDAVILVLGGRYWEITQAGQLYEQLHLHRQLIPVVNYGDAQAARAYARDWRRNVYCFPLDRDPMALSAEKRRFFDLLQRKERW